jgi:hypothetical protein
LRKISTRNGATVADTATRSLGGDSTVTSAPIGASFSVKSSRMRSPLVA